MCGTESSPSDALTHPAKVEISSSMINKRRRCSAVAPFVFLVRVLAVTITLPASSRSIGSDALSSWAAVRPRGASPTALSVLLKLYPVERGQKRLRTCQRLLPAIFAEPIPRPVHLGHPRIAGKLVSVPVEESPIQRIERACAHPVGLLHVVAAAPAVVRHTIDIGAGSHIGFRGEQPPSPNWLMPSVLGSSTHSKASA